MSNIDSIPYVNTLFEQSWWLEALAPGKLSEVTVERDGKIIARLPYVHIRKYGINCISLPPFTPFAGPWIQKTSDRMAYRLGYEKEVLLQLIDSLPRHISIHLRLCPEQFYYLPFLWRGFSIYPCVTYRIEAISNLDDTWNSFHKGTRSAIRKAEKILHVDENQPIDRLFDMMKLTFARQKRAYKIDETMFRRLDNTCKEHKASKFMCAIDAEGNIHTATYYVFDENVIYALAGGSDPEYRNSQSDAFLIWVAIKFASGKIKSFDFEGSSIEGIERFFRSFGGKPIVYFCVKRQSLFHDMLDCVKPHIKRMIGYE